MNLKQKHLVLVVDDQDASAIEAICTSLGLTVHVAASQAAAEDLLAKQAYCLVLVDLHLPVNGATGGRIGTGLNLVRALRARHDREALPVIVVTGHGQDHRHAVMAMKEGATDFAKKPFDDDYEPLDAKLVEALADTCEARHRFCPQAAGVALREREGAGRRHYSAAHRLHFTGERNGDRCALLVDGQPRWVTLKTFEILWDLAMADRDRDRYPEGAVPGTDLHSTNVWRMLARIEEDLAEHAGGPRLIERARRGFYCLTIPPEHVTFDLAALAVHHPLLARSAREAPLVAAG